jgi:hypothetical protein
MTPKQLDQINESAVFHPQLDEYTSPAIEVAGAFVFAYVDEAGVLRVRVHLEDASPDVFPCDWVPLQVTVGSTVVYQAGRDGSDEIDVDRRSTDGPPTVIHRPGEPLLVFGDVDVHTDPFAARKYLKQLKDGAQ